MFHVQLEKFGRIIAIMMFLLALTHGSTACDSSNCSFDEAGTRASESEEPPIEAACGATELAGGDAEPEWLNCSQCPRICREHGQDSLDCESCWSWCVYSAAPTSDTTAGAAGEVEPEWLSCSQCPRICREHGQDSLDCESCWSWCVY